jgi:hypothetical protein
MLREIAGEINGQFDAYPIMYPIIDARAPHIEDYAKWGHSIAHPQVKWAAYYHMLDIGRHYGRKDLVREIMYKMYPPATEPNIIDLSRCYGCRSNAPWHQIMTATLPNRF